MRRRGECNWIILAKEMPGDARNFDSTDGDALLPNMVAYTEDKDKYNQSLY